MFKRLYAGTAREQGTIRYFREVLNRRNVTMDVKHFEDCEQLFLSVGGCYIIEAMLEFFQMDDVDQRPMKNYPFAPNSATDDEKESKFLAIVDKFINMYVLGSPAPEEDTMTDGVCNYSVNLIKSFMIILNCKNAVASGNGEHLAVIQKQMLHYFFSVPGYNAYAIEMLVTIIQNEVLLSPAEAHQCKWAAVVNWKGGDNKNIEIDLLQENRNRDIKQMIHQMGANKTEKAITRMSKAAGGVRNIVDVFEEEASVKQKTTAHSHKTSTDGERKVQISAA